MTTKLYDFEAAMRIMELIIEDVDVETALATEEPVGEVEIEEVVNDLFGIAETETKDGGDD